MTTVVWYRKSSEFPQIYIVSLYMDINTPVITNDLKNLVHHCSTRNLPLIILTDANAHSSLWGCSSSNKRGEDLEDFLINNSLTILNTGSIPTFDCNRGKSIIDISVVSHHIEEIAHSWRVIPEDMCSDHKCIEFELNMVPQTNFFRSYKNVDWLIFKDTVETPFKSLPPPKMWTTETIEGQLAQFYKIIDHAIEEQAPLLKRKDKILFKWYKDELRKEKVALQRLYRKYKKNKTAWETYLEARRKYNSNIQAAKKDSWREYVNSTADLKSAAILEKILQSSKSLNVNFIKQKDGELAKSPQESLDILMSEHFPMCSPDSAKTPEELWLNSLESPREIPGLPWITVSKIRKALLSFGPDKAAGPDKLKPKLLQQLPEAALEHLRALFTACITLGYTPELWRTSKTIFIPKPGKKDYGAARSFRPISLTSFLFKTLEKLVSDYIEGDIYPPQQPTRLQERP
jgi:hypothetical protein